MTRSAPKPLYKEELKLLNAAISNKKVSRATGFTLLQAIAEADHHWLNMSKKSQTAFVDTLTKLAYALHSRHADMDSKFLGRACQVVTQEVYMELVSTRN